MGDRGIRFAALLLGASGCVTLAVLWVGTLLSWDGSDPWVDLAAGSFDVEAGESARLVVEGITASTCSIDLTIADRGGFVLARSVDVLRPSARATLGVHDIDYQHAGLRIGLFARVRALEAGESGQPCRVRASVEILDQGGATTRTVILPARLGGR